MFDSVIFRDSVPVELLVPDNGVEEGKAGNVRR